MDFLATIAMSTMVQRWCRPAGENNAPTQNSLDTMDAHDLWSLLLRWGAAGRRNLVSFVSQLTKAKARSVPRVLAGRARQAWHHRWSSMLACASARAFTLSLLDCRPVVGAHGLTPSSSEVLAACRHLPLALA